MVLIKKIKSLIKGEVKSDFGTLKKYSRDASIFEIKPQLVAFPKDIADIKALVTFAATQASKQKLSLTARTAGTDMTGGPLNDSIILDLTRYFNHIKEMSDHSVWAEPGVYYRDFEKWTLKYNLLMPAYPASREICCLGGMVGNNAGGEKTLAYGKVEDYVKELKVVLEDGNEYRIKPLTKNELEKKCQQNSFEGKLYRKISQLIIDNKDLLERAKPNVSKNSAGYFLWNVWQKDKFDLTKLLVGSQGTLGIITDINFELIKPVEHSQLLIIFLNDLGQLAKIITEVLKHRPESFECFDDATLKFALKYLGEIAKVLKFHHLIRFIWELLPEFTQSLKGQLPKLVLLAEFTADQKSKVLEKTKAALEEVQKLGLEVHLTKNEHQARKYWVIRRESFNLLRRHARGMKASPFIDDIVVHPKDLPTFLPKLQHILKPFNKKLIYTIAGHIGDANFHIIPLMSLKDPEAPKIIKEVSEKVYKLVFEYKGSITAEHSDGLIRTPFLKEMYGEKVYSLFRETKKIFDPNNIFNPGKKVGDTISYSVEHLLQD